MLDGTATSDLYWRAAGAEYHALRAALDVYDTQLHTAPRARVRDAQLALVNRLRVHADMQRQP